MNRKSIVRIDRLNQIANDSKDELTEVYEAGAYLVLRQIAMREVRFMREHTGPEYEAAARQSDAVDTAYEKLKSISPKAVEKDIDAFNDAVRRLEFESSDAGFIAGFVAGYRFLKEISPE